MFFTTTARDFVPVQLRKGKNKATNLCNTFELNKKIQKLLISPFITLNWAKINDLQKSIRAIKMKKKHFWQVKIKVEMTRKKSKF